MQISLFITSMIILGCEPTITWKFVIRNNSDYNLLANYSTAASEDTTIFVEHDSTLSLFQYRTVGIASETSEHRFKELFKSIRLLVNDQIVYEQVPADQTYWNHTKEGKPFHGYLIYTIEITNKDLYFNKPAEDNKK